VGAGRRAYELSVLDNFTSVGPVRDLVVGEAAESASAGGSAGGPGAAPQHELVVAAGHGKNGGVAVLHGGVLPEVIREVELPGVQVSVYTYVCVHGSVPPPHVPPAVGGKTSKGCGFMQIVAKGRGKVADLWRETGWNYRLLFVSHRECGPFTSERRTVTCPRWTARCCMSTWC
jgi:hypothetical protein